MAGSERIEISVDAAGKVTIEGHEFTGKACDEFIRDLSEALGSIEHVERKPEYYREAAVHTRTVQR